jgi:hypothetical protein
MTRAMDTNTFEPHSINAMLAIFIARQEAESVARVAQLK